MLDPKDLIGLQRHKGLNLNMLYFPIVAAIIYLFCILFDSGPVLPPFSKDFSSIDCRSVRFDSFREDYGFVHFSFLSDPSIEYPSEYLPHFISLTLNSTQSSFFYSSNNIKNLSRAGNRINFSIAHPFSGEYKMSFKCLDTHFGTQKLVIQDVLNFSSLTSVFTDPGSDALLTKNVCTESGRLFILTPAQGHHSLFQYDQIRIQFDIYPWELSSYMEYKNISLNNDTTFILAPFDFVWWKLILFSLQPLASSLEKNTISNRERITLSFIGLPQKGTADILKRFNQNPPVKLKEPACFKKLIYTKTRSGIELKDTSLIEEALKSNFSSLRSYFIKFSTSPKKIALPTCLKNIESDILEVCPDCEILPIGPRIDITQVADIISKSQVFIGNHFSNLINMIWLGSTNTSVIDLSPDTEKCVNWASSFAQKNNITYYSLNEKPARCSCTDFSCLTPNPMIDPEIDHSHFKSLLQRAIF